jgi:hypothetical protein
MFKSRRMISFIYRGTDRGASDTIIKNVEKEIEQGGETKNGAAI